jgi:hydrophobic/amphiphilic exporter-1 (mainly G- bacteria), HAE1 family
VSLARFGVRKPVPVNLLMTAIILAGLVSGMSLRREFFPETDPEKANVTLPYPGVTPDDLEETLAIKVEDKLIDLDEVKELSTTLTEGGGGITVEFREDADPDDALDEVQRAIDALTDLPEESEKIQVRLFEPRLPVIRVALYGDLDEQAMKRAIRGVRDDLRDLPGMGETLVEGVRDYEIRVDARVGALLEHGLSLPAVADTVRRWMTDIPGGTVRTGTGNVKVRTLGVDERAEQIRNILLRSDPQGRSVRLGDIATVTDSFVDEQLYYRFNGQPAANLTVFKVGDQDIVKIAEMVRAYVDGQNAEPFVPASLDERLAVSLPSFWPWLANLHRANADLHRLDAWEKGLASKHPLPAGASLVTNTDLARFVEGRLDLLLRNAKYGAILVFATLLLFLNWRVAMWVGVGLLTAIMGTLVLMSWLDVTLNLLTMFGLIVVLGLLVDDAIVVAENIQARHDRGEPSLQAAVSGTDQVAWPVVATVMTSVVAFLPLTFIKGRIGDLLGALPMVVACALVMSLIESLLILPSHMGHTLVKRDKSQPGKGIGLVRRAEKWRDHIVLDRLIPAYGKLIGVLLHYRYIATAGAVGVLVVSLGLVKGGQVGFNFLPTSDSETLIIDVNMPIGFPIEQTNKVVKLIEQAAISQPEYKAIGSVIGQRANVDTGATEAFAPHVAQIFVELKPVEQRTRESSKVIESIRQALKGRVDQAQRITYSEINGGPGGKDITIRARGDSPQHLEAAVNDLRACLSGYQGVHDISDNNDVGQVELRGDVKPEAEALGFTPQEVARQIRGLLFGIDAHVFAADQEDIDVRVRADEDMRRSLFAVQNAWLVNPAGLPVPMNQVADFTENLTYATIHRFNKQRSITLQASVAPGVSPEDIVGKLTSPVTEKTGWFRWLGLGSIKVTGPSPLDKVRAKYPGVTIELAGRQQQMADAFGSLPLGFLAAAVMIYVILAWLFSSYFQPLVVMLVIPFSLVGVIWGHLLLGYELTFLSLIGFVALSGIVVNDSLILVEFYNKMRAKGQSVRDALVAAGKARLRAILLTTITTVLGLTPLILERSFQAKFLIPMAISIAMGLISATVLILVVLPCVMVIFDDIAGLLYHLWYGRPRTIELSHAVTAGEEHDPPQTTRTHQ